MSLISLAPRIIAGSALAGFGFALGRDVYKVTKKKIGWIVIVIMVLAILFFVYTSSVWVSRNYRTITQSIFKKIGALIVFIPSYYITFLLLTFLTPMFWGFLEALYIEIFSPTASAFREPFPYVDLTYRWVNFLFTFIPGSISSSSSPSQEILNFSFVQFFLLHIIVLAGIVRGLSHRKKRRLAWEAEDHNAAFFIENGIEELDGENFRDSKGNRYRLENVFSKEIELFAEGRRGKRAYIKFDETGKFTTWSGLTSISQSPT